MTLRFLNSKILTVALALLASSLPAIVFGQGSVSFTVSPTIFDMTAEPGQQFRSTVRVINANPYDLQIYVEVSDFRPKGETGTPEFIPLSESDPGSTLAHWISAEQVVPIPAERTVEVPFTITLPKDAPPGGHFAALMISTRPTVGEESASQVQTAQVISSLIFLRVSGEITENSSIRAFRSTDYILSRPDTTFELRIENKGNVHVQPQGEIKIRNMWGQERGVIDVNQETLFGNVLPNSVRKYSFAWTGDWSITDIGRYTAEATLAYGNTARQFMYAETVFWVIPWKLILLIISIVVGFFWLMSWGIKLYIERVLSLAGVVDGHRTSFRTEIDTSSTLNERVTIPIKGARKSKRQFASVIAPLEMGMLDLRTQLNATVGPWEFAAVILRFIRQYWKFFILVAVFILFIVSVTWFVRGAVTPSREYEITVTDDAGSSVRVSSKQESLPVTSEPVDTPITEQTFSLALVNRSGNSAIGKAVEERLQNAGYTVTSLTEEAGSREERTVIVYDPTEATAALAMSQLLDIKLLSAFTDTTVSGTRITIYIGTETIPSEEE